MLPWKPRDRTQDRLPLLVTVGWRPSCASPSIQTRSTSHRTVQPQSRQALCCRLRRKATCMHAVSQSYTVLLLAISVPTFRTTHNIGKTRRPRLAKTTQILGLRLTNMLPAHLSLLRIYHLRTTEIPRICSHAMVKAREPLPGGHLFFVAPYLETYIPRPLVISNNDLSKTWTLPICRTTIVS